MDVIVNVEKFRQFLEKCSLQGIIKDLVVHTNGNAGLFSKFADKSKTMYGEVYLTEIKINEEGNIRIPNLKKLMEIMKRCDSDLVRIKSTADAVVFSDGVGVGKFNAKILQTSDAELVESFDPIANNLSAFDKDTLTYANGLIQYADGFEMPTGMLMTLVDDAKAFSYEIFTINYAKGSLKCKLENTATTEKFTRTIADSGGFGSVDNMPSVVLGLGFKEMVKTLDKANNKEKIKMYIDERCILLTNGKDVYFNLATVE